MSAAIFPKDTRIKMLDPKGFKRVMKKNETSVIAFVAPWCGHCQRMAPEYSKAALSLHPLVPLYAVDCDDEGNKRLCGEQGVNGFPTVKLFPRGNQKPSVSYDSPTRTASAFFFWASRLVPNNVKKLNEPEDITNWASKKVSKPRALLLHKDKKIPLLWQVLSNKYGHDIQFGNCHDGKGKASVSMGLKAGQKKASKVVIYPVDSTVPVLYEGLNKFDSLSKFFNSVLDGTADLKLANDEIEAEKLVAMEQEIKIQQKQEAQHVEFVDFDKNGHSDTMDNTAPPKEEKEKVSEKVELEPEDPNAPVGQDEQVILEPATVTEHTVASVVEPVETQRAAAAFPSPELVEEHPRDEAATAKEHTVVSVVEPQETRSTVAAPSPEVVEEHPRDEL